MKWNITRLLATGSLGVVNVVLLLFGAAITAITGIPGGGGIINIFVWGMMFAFCCLLIRQFGCATVMSFVTSIIAIPLPLLGTPGFLPKIAIGISVGLIADCLYALLKRKEKLAAFVVGAIPTTLIGLEILGLGLLFSIPGIEQFAKFLSIPVAIGSLAFGAFGGYIGYRIFSNLRDTAVVKRIHG